MSEDNFEKGVNVAGGVVLGKGIKTAVTAMTGSNELGQVAEVASKFVPDRVKSSAVVGGILSASIPAHAIAIGTAGGMAFGLPLLLPFALGGAVIFGIGSLLFGSDD